MKRGETKFDCWNSPTSTHRVSQSESCGTDVTAPFINKWSGESTIRPAGGAYVLNPSRFVDPAASIISPRSGVREHKHSRGAKSPWGWSAASDSGLFRHKFSAHWCSVFVCPDNSLSVRKQDPLRGAAACRWLKLFPVQTSSPEEETTMYHEETSTLPKPHYGSE